MNFIRAISAADDAAGLAIRELMKADIATLHQGIRNANDAISLIQTADGALQVIDEKLVRMKELAEQAATGTYTSTQRLIIDSEYQAMASEITRIAHATDFNGIKLLDGTLSAPTHDGSGMESKGKLKIHFGTGNDSAEDYYYITIGDCTATAFGVGDSTTYGTTMDRAKAEFANAIYGEFGHMATGTIEERAAYQQALDAVEDIFSDIDTKYVNKFFDDSKSLEEQYAEYSKLFTKPSVGADTEVGDSEFFDTPKIYSSVEELQKAALDYYKAETATGLGGENAFSADNHATALNNIAKMFDNAIIVGEGGRMLPQMTQDEFKKLSDAERESLKVDLAMAALNTAVNGTNAQQSSLEPEAVGAGADGRINYQNYDSMAGADLGTATGRKAYDETQIQNFIKHLDYGYSAGRSKTNAVNSLTELAIGKYTTGTVGAANLPAGTVITAENTKLTNGVYEIMEDTRLTGQSKLSSQYTLKAGSTLKAGTILTETAANQLGIDAALLDNAPGVGMKKLNGDFTLNKDFISGNSVSFADGTTATVTLGENFTPDTVLALPGGATLGGDTTLTSSQILHGTTTVNGTTTLGSETILGGNTTLVGVATTSGYSVLKGSTTTGTDTVTMGSGSILHGNSIWGGGALDEKITVHGDTKLGAKFTTTAEKTLHGTTILNGIPSIKSGTILYGTTVNGDTTLAKGATLYGNTILGGDTTVKGDTKLNGSTSLGAGSKIEEGSTLKAGTVITAATFGKDISLKGATKSIDSTSTFPITLEEDMIVDGGPITDFESSSIAAGSTLAEDSILAAKSTLGEGTSLGDSTELGNGTLLGDGTILGETALGSGTILGEGTILAASTELDSGTKIGEGTQFVKGDNLGAGTTLGDGTIIEGKLANNTVLGDGTVLGAGTKLPAGLTLHAGTILGSGTTIGDGTELPEGTVLGSGTKLGTGTLIGNGTEWKAGNTLPKGTIINGGKIPSNAISEGTILNGLQVGDKIGAGTTWDKELTGMINGVVVTVPANTEVPGEMILTAAITDPITLKNINKAAQAIQAAEGSTLKAGTTLSAGNTVPAGVDIENQLMFTGTSDKKELNGVYGSLYFDAETATIKRENENNYGSFQSAVEKLLTRVGTETAGKINMDGNNIKTQESAQRALAALDKAIVQKDNIRAHIGALQNRLENTITNLTTQAENLQASESRISDVDVATEMTEFTRNQILTQSAVAMLAQANSLPQMAMKLIGG